MWQCGSLILKDISGIGGKNGDASLLLVSMENNFQENFMCLKISLSQTKDVNLNGRNPLHLILTVMASRCEN